MSDLNLWANSIGVRAEKRILQKTAIILREIEESVAAGIIPSQLQWQALASLPEPWGELTYQSISELRASGAAVLPTLKRMRALAQEHEAALLDAKARSAQSLSQAVLCAILVPIFGSILYLILPGIDQHPYPWILACMGAIAFSSVASGWMLQLSSSARWAGLPETHRPWILACQCAGERFLALIRAGSPADLAWSKAIELLASHAPDLSYAWGASVWSVERQSLRSGVPAEGALIEFGAALKRTVQVALMEGRPCGDRVESALASLKQEIRSQIDRELSVLPTKTLKPLFLLVAPSILGVLFFGIYLCWLQAVSGR